MSDLSILIKNQIFTPSILKHFKSQRVDREIFAQFSDMVKNRYHLKEDVYRAISPLFLSNSFSEIFVPEQQLQFLKSCEKSWKQFILYCSEDVQKQFLAHIHGDVSFKALNRTILIKKSEEFVQDFLYLVFFRGDSWIDDLEMVKRYKGDFNQLDKEGNPFFFSIMPSNYSEFLSKVLKKDTRFNLELRNKEGQNFLEYTQEHISDATLIKCLKVFPERTFNILASRLFKKSFFDLQWEKEKNNLSQAQQEKALAGAIRRSGFKKISLIKEYSQLEKDTGSFLLDYYDFEIVRNRLKTEAVAKSKIKIFTNSVNSITLPWNFSTDTADSIYLKNLLFFLKKEPKIATVLSAGQTFDTRPLAQAIKEERLKALKK